MSAINSAIKGLQFHLQKDESADKDLVITNKLTESEKSVNGVPDNSVTNNNENSNAIEEDSIRISICSDNIRQVLVVNIARSNFILHGSYFCEKYDPFLAFTRQIICNYLKQHFYVCI